MAAAAPRPQSSNPVKHFLHDLRIERGQATSYPPGWMRFSVARTRQVNLDPLPLILDGYRRFGPIYTIRVLHVPVVFMLGPEANHYVTVSHSANFLWREGSMGDLIPLLGDGLLTTDGEIHRSARRIVLPAFHRERIAATAGTMIAETERALQHWRAGHELDLYRWTRALALRVAMRALFGFDPDATRRDFDPADEFERALSYFGEDYFVQLMRGPATPWDRLRRSRARLDRLIFEEIARRRRRPGGQDVLSLLLEARDEDGGALSDRQVRDQVMTLMFAGHDTTTSTVSFLFYELARHPRVVDRLLAEQDSVLAGRSPTPEQLVAELPELEMAMDETLRLYPPAWIGPRRCIEEFELAGHRVPAGARVTYCSWASHRLPDVFPDPEAFVPERFHPEQKAKLPKGAYVPFGGGSRICIGMRFGQLEIKAIATLILQRFRLELAPGYRMRIREMPTLSPRDGLPMRMRER